MKSLHFFIILFAVGLLPVHAFGQYLDQKDRFNHPANHFFVTSGWQDELLSGKRSIEDFRQYVVDNSDFIFEGRIVKRAYEYSKKPVYKYGTEAYALNTMLITYVFKGDAAKKSVVLKTRHGYPGDTLYRATGHRMTLEWPTTETFEGDAIFFCKKVGNTYQLVWESCGAVPVGDLGDRPFVSIGVNILEKYGKFWQQSLNITDEQFQKILPSIKGNREEVYRVLATYCKGKVKRRFLKRAEAFNGDERKSNTS